MKVITTAQVAEILQYHPGSFRRLLVQKKIPGPKVPEGIQARLWSPEDIARARRALEKYEKNRYKRKPKKISEKILKRS